MNLGVIGCGGIADRRTIPGILTLPNWRIVAVSDATPDIASRIAAKYNLPKACSTEELLADPQVEAVYIATPVYLHKEQALAAAAAGKHIMIEKPIGLTAVEGQEIVAACKRAKVTLMEGYMMKFHPLHQAAKRMIEDGRLGRLVFLRAQLSCWYPPMEGAWRQKQALGGGGALMDLAGHLYDLMAWFAGPVTQVSAQVGNLVHHYETDDSSLTMLHFVGGAYGVADAMFNIPDASVPNRLEIYGDQGSLLAEGTIGQGTGGTMTARLEQPGKGYDAQQERAEQGEFQVKPEGEVASLYAAEFDHFRRAIESGGTPKLNSGEDGVRIMQVIEAAYQSARSGRAMLLSV